MADRFPSLEDIDAGQTAARESGYDVDLMDGGADTGDFLSRERAALGADANQFATSNDAAARNAQVVDEADLMGESNGADDGGMSSFQTSFPSIDAQNARMGPGGTITGTGAVSSHPYRTQPQDPSDDSEESAVIREWRERRSQAIQNREDAASARKEETVKNAQTAVDDFYENYNSKRDRSIAQTRKDAEKFLESREDTTAGGTSWERIAKLVDLKGPKGGQGAAAGKERFKELLSALVKDENAPGAKGY